MHNDAYASNVYTGPGPLGNKPVVTSALYGVEECATIAFDTAGRIVGLCGAVQGSVLRLINPSTLAGIATYNLPGRNLAIVADEANAEKCAKGLFHTFIVDVRAPENPVPISTLPTPTGRDFCGLGTFGPHNLHENRPGSFQSEETLFATYNVAGVRVFDIRDAFAPKEIASWIPPTPKKLIDPRPNVSLAAKAADIFVAKDGLIYVSDWNAGLNVLQYEG